MFCRKRNSKGTNRAYFVDRREFEGSIQEQMEAAYQYVLEKINMGMTIKGMYRQDVYELPTDSIRELIANAVAHRLCKALHKRCYAKLIVMQSYCRIHWFYRKSGSFYFA